MTTFLDCGRQRLLVRAFALFCLGSCVHGPQPSALDSAREALRELRVAVLHEIKDPERAAQGAQLVDEAERLLLDASTGLKAHDAKVRALNADYDATPEAFRAAFKDFNAQQSEHLQRLLDIDRRAKRLTTAQEWAALDKAREKALEKAVRAGRES